MTHKTTIAKCTSSLRLCDARKSQKFWDMQYFNDFEVMAVCMKAQVMRVMGNIMWEPYVDINFHNNILGMLDMNSELFIIVYYKKGINQKPMSKEANVVCQSKSLYYRFVCVCVCLCVYSCTIDV